MKDDKDTKTIETAGGSPSGASDCSARSCRRCVHSSDFDENFKLLCVAKNKWLHVNDCCEGFRQISQDEINERCHAQFAKLCLPILGQNAPDERQA